MLQSHLSETCNVPFKKVNSFPGILFLSLSYGYFKEHLFVALFELRIDEKKKN